MKKLLSLMLAVMLALTLIPASAFALEGTPPNIKTASNWAVPHIEKAYAAEIIPDSMMENYKADTTRVEFCQLTLNYLIYLTGKTADELLAERGLTVDSGTFTDTDDPQVLAAAALSIVSGIGGTRFGPETGFNREQAATMIRNLYRLFDGYDTENAPTAGFKDMADIAGYALSSVNFVRAEGIMEGSAGAFSPKAAFSREMSITTFAKIMPELESKWKAATKPLTKEELEANRKGPFTGRVSQPDLSSGKYTGSKEITRAYLLDDNVTIPVFLQLLETMRFYVNDAGKLCMDVTFPDLPEGYGWYFHAQMPQLVPKTIDELDYFTSYAHSNYPEVQVDSMNDALWYETNFTASGSQHKEIALRDPNTSFDDLWYIEVSAQIIGPDSVSTWMYIESPHSRFTVYYPNIIAFGTGDVVYSGHSPIRQYWDADAGKNVGFPVERVMVPYSFDDIFTYYNR